MSEKKPHEPADTQMFRAFVERGEPEAPARRRTVPVLLAVLVVAVVAAVIVFALG